ncbi:MAG TPA: DUF922 domain-containing protein [Candidatus Bipolaricaulis sp.]|nr:DUF922 domain-containing protein [Candidatus Bipolaricaulis sp.]HRS14212.1 DUF922 domain-containing protein [Candidatus Bipolaricaulis sp.]HRU21715.1 DUF922 domain-containing protein [Candidatus Bipolaricaulis sp.]
MMKRGLGLVLCAVWAVVGTGQGEASLSWSWAVTVGQPCPAAGGTVVQFQIPEGSPTTVSLSVSATPPRTISLVPLALPGGRASASSGWGTATTVYTFTPPPGSAGQEVEIVYRAAVEGVAPVDLRITLKIGAPSPSCALPPPPPTASHPTARLYWDAGRPITWADFWGEPPPDRDPQAAAGIALALEYSLTLATGREGAVWRARVASSTVTAAMERDRSWALSDRRTAAGLSHEQRHFDLAEAYRRLLAAQLPGIVGTGATEADAHQDLLAQAAAAFRDVNDRHGSIQAQYDRETDHGRNALRQAEWERRIAAWLLAPSSLP